MDPPTAEPQQNTVHKDNSPDKTPVASKLPDPGKGLYVTTRTSTGRWIYCVSDPELVKKLRDPSEWLYYPTVAEALHQRPQYNLYRPCRLKWMALLTQKRKEEQAAQAGISKNLQKKAILLPARMHT